MKSDPSVWTDTFLDEMRHHADPLADSVIEEIIESGQRPVINLIFATLRDNASLRRDLLPPVLKDYFERAAALPHWADQALLDKGAKFFGMYGLEIATLLNYKSLPSAYVCPKGATVLHATGRLEEFQGSTAKFQRRIMETAQFVFNVCDINGFKPQGRAVESAMKVRLMHAAIRYYIRRDGHWDTDTLGLPINQEDMTGTMLSFSSLIQEGLGIMGIYPPDDLSEGYFHLWRVVGHLMGIDPRLIPTKQADGHTLGWKILNRNIGKATQGKELTQALIDFTRQAVPGARFDHLPEVFIRHYCGDKIADDLGVRRYGFFWTRVFPSFIDFFIRDLQKVTHVTGFTSRLSAKLSRHLLQHTINQYYHHRKVEFFIPPSLRGNPRLTIPLTTQHS